MILSKLQMTKTSSKLKYQMWYLLYKMNKLNFQVRQNQQNKTKQRKIKTVAAALILLTLHQSLVVVKKIKNINSKNNHRVQ
jgi:hypothetical protein